MNIVIYRYFKKVGESKKTLKKLLENSNITLLSKSLVIHFQASFLLYRRKYLLLLILRDSKKPYK